MHAPLRTVLTAAAPSLALLGACATGGEPRDAEEPERRPNILFVYTDDHASHAISAYGSRINETPNIDRLAAEGLRFANSFVGNSICGPARATILTGKHSHANGVINNGVEFDGAQTTFPKLLQKVGYQTVMLGKWHLRSDPTGFDHWEVMIGQGPYYNPELVSAAGKRRVEGYTTDVITDLALEWLEEDRDPRRPFCLMVQHKAPHRNWQPGPEHLTDYDGAPLPEPVTLFDDYATRASGAATQEMTIDRHLSEHDLKLSEQGGLTDEQRAAWDAAYGPKNAAFRAAGLEGDDLVRWKYQRYMKDYLRCIAAVDDGLGRILDYLDESGLAGNTVVVYSSDQGFYLGDHGWYDKRWMYEESLRTPLIVRWPGRTRAGSVEEALVQNIDMAPTFLELAGVEAPDDVHGRSLLPLFVGRRPADWRTSIYYRYYEFPGVHAVPRHRGVRTARYKLVDFHQLGERELYDLEADPNELFNVIDDPNYDDVQEELEVELERLRVAYGDELPAEAESGTVEAAKAPR